MRVEMLVHERLPTEGVFEAHQERRPDLSVFSDLVAFQYGLLVQATNEDAPVPTTDHHILARDCT